MVSTKIGTRKLSIKDMHNDSAARGGKCLSSSYVNAHVKLKWSCSFGHIFRMNANSVRRGSWCPTCANKIRADKKRLTIEIMREMAAERGGKCLSTSYRGANYRLRWKCAEGHIWETDPRNIRKGHWCHQCAFNNHPYNNRYTIENMRQLASERGGSCLSKKYVNLQTKLKWKCAQGHVWKGIPASVVKGHWCYECGREELKYKLTDAKELAKKSNGKCLSKRCLDGFSRLKWQCHKGHVWSARFHKVREGSWCPECHRTSTQLTMNEIQALARSRGGKCLSKEYINDKHQLTWQCKKGHIWEAGLYQVKGNPDKKIKGTWCNQCSILLRIGKPWPKPGTIREMKELARTRGGKCISDYYVNSKTKLTWKCRKKHCWDAVPGNIKRGGWCPICRHRKKLTIEEMQRIAKRRSGKCLSKKYIDSNTKLKWQCHKKHTWNAVPMSVKRGSWCPECAREQSRMPRGKYRKRTKSKA